MGLNLLPSAPTLKKYSAADASLGTCKKKKSSAQSEAYLGTIENDDVIITRSMKHMQSSCDQQSRPK